MKKEIITNRILMNGSTKDIQKLYEEVKRNDLGIGSIDFEKILPVPERIARGEFTSEEKADLDCFKDDFTDPIKAWRKVYWGTASNAFGFCNNPAWLESNVLEFQTRNGSCFPVIEALSEKYPNIDFAYTWASNRFGATTGQARFTMGEVKAYFVPRNNSDYAIDIASELLGEPEDFGIGPRRNRRQKRGA